MSLSRIKNKGEIGVFQLLLEIATSLEDLTKNPKALSEAAKDAYRLSDEEEAKAAAAKALIAESDKAVSAARKEQENLDAKLVEFAQAKASVDGIMESIRKERARLADVDAAQGARALQLNEKENDLAERERILERGNQKLLADSAAFDKRAQAVIADEQALKAKAEKLKGLLDA